MKTIHLVALFCLACFAFSCNKKDNTPDLQGRPCHVTRIIESTQLGTDTTWISYDAQNRPVREDYSNPHTYWKYIYQDNKVIEQHVITATGEVIYEAVSYLNAQGLADYLIIQGTDTSFFTYDAKGRLIGERRRSFDYNYEYHYDARGDWVLSIHRNYNGTVVKGTMDLEYYLDISPNPKANTSGTFSGLVHPWSGRPSTHALKKIGDGTYQYELDSDNNVRKSTYTNGNYFRTVLLEYRCS